MRKLEILLIVLLYVSLGFTFVELDEKKDVVEHEFKRTYGDYVTITNEKYNAVTLTVWYCGSGNWEVIDRVHIPSYYTTTVAYQKGERHLYGYSIPGYHSVRTFYSDHVRLY